MFRLACFTLASLFLANISWAGGEIGNGGGGVHCRDNETGAEYLQVLDLWEGANLQGFQYKRTQDAETARLQFDRALERLRQHNAYLYVQLLEYTYIRDKFDGGFQRVHANHQIAPPQDARPIIIGRHCKLRGIALYDDLEDILWLDVTLFEELSQTDRQALILHEMLFKYLREHFEMKYSTVARQMVACLFSENQSCDHFDPFLTPEPYAVLCTDSGPIIGPQDLEKVQLAFLIKKNSRSNTKKLQFVKIDDQLLPKQTTGKLPLNFRIGRGSTNVGVVYTYGLFNLYLTEDANRNLVKTIMAPSSRYVKAPRFSIDVSRYGRKLLFDKRPVTCRIIDAKQSRLDDLKILNQRLSEQPQEARDLIQDLNR